MVDLASLESVREANEEVLSWDVTINIVINNAAIFGMEDFTTRNEGYELIMAVCYVKHFLLANLIKPKLSAAPRAVDDVSGLGNIRRDIELEDPWFGVSSPPSSPGGECGAMPGGVLTI